MKFWIQAFNAGTFWVPDFFIQCRLQDLGINTNRGRVFTGIRGGVLA